ncbi:MAG: hypothetical protein L6R42_003840 [Xanthoria sp. 1 TBL-2021]|nr:MAG: hypothetical protein L6R42_003840 [Xanthoria sp. 1 TBL-2021]
MSVPWEETEQFVSTSNREIQPGGLTAYNPPRPIGQGENAEEDITSFHPGQADWSPENMPDVSVWEEILYMYMAPKERDDFYKEFPRRPAPKYIGNDVVLEKWPVPGTAPRQLLDFPHLPDQIGTNEWWWMFEAWRRLDPRITWKDIHMRQYGPNRKAHSNTIQKLVSRNRSTAMMVTWPQQRQCLKTSNEKRRVHEYDPLDPKDKPQARSQEKIKDNPKGKAHGETRGKSRGRARGGSHAKSQETTKTNSKGKKKTIKNIDLVTPLMTDAQKEANTTRGLTPGLINKDLGDIPGNRVPWPKQLRRAGRHKPNRPAGAPRSRSNDSQATKSQGPSREQSLGFEGGAASDMDNETISDNETDSGEDQSFESSEDNGELQEASTEQTHLARGGLSADTGAHSGSPFSRSYGSQTGVGLPHLGDVQVGGQFMPFQALGGTVPHEAITSRGHTLGPYSPSLRTVVQPDVNEGSYLPDNSGPRLRDLNTTTYPHFPAPSQGGNPLHAIQRHPDDYHTTQNTPATTDNPAHALYIPPYTARAPSTAPVQRPPTTLNPQAPPFVPSQTHTSDYHNGNHKAPPASANQQAQNMNRNTAHNGHYHPPPPAPSTTRITDLIRLTCPDDLTPDRWAQFLDFCLAHGIGQQTPSHQPAFASDEHALFIAAEGDFTVLAAIHNETLTKDGPRSG